MQRVKAIAGPSSGPREGGSFATSARLPASLGHSPFFPLPTPPPPPLCNLYTPFKCQSGSIWAQPCSGSLTTARGPRPRQWHWETRAGGERASLQSAAEPPGAGRAWGPCVARRQLHRPGSQFRRGIGHAGASLRSCSGGHSRVGALGCRAQRPAPGWGLGVHWEPGVKMGGEPEARLGWIINTLGGIRQAGSRPA